MSLVSHELRPKSATSYCDVLWYLLSGRSAVSRNLSPIKPQPSLAALHFSSIEERVYRVLVEHPHCALREVAVRCNAPEPIVRGAVEHLAERKLIDVDHDIVEAIDPQLSLTAVADELLHRTSGVLDELSQLSSGISALSRRYAERRLGSVAVEKISNDDLVRIVSTSLNRRTRVELRNMQRFPISTEDLGTGHRLTAAALPRGVRVRSLYEPNALAEQRDATMPLRELGSEIRSGPTPFERLLISDLEFALLKAEADGVPSTFLIREPSLVLTLAKHFRSMLAAGCADARRQQTRVRAAAAHTPVARRWRYRGGGCARM